jgi:hypothetical protein
MSMCVTLFELLAHTMLSSNGSGNTQPLSAPTVHSHMSGGMIPVPSGSDGTPLL